VRSDEPCSARDEILHWSGSLRLVYEPRLRSRMVLRTEAGEQVGPAVRALAAADSVLYGSLQGEQANR
jgi:hypothetical protein